MDTPKLETFKHCALPSQNTLRLSFSLYSVSQSYNLDFYINWFYLLIYLLFKIDFDHFFRTMWQ